MGKDNLDLGKSLAYLAEGFKKKLKEYEDKALELRKSETEAAKKLEKAEKLCKKCGKKHALAKCGETSTSLKKAICKQCGKSGCKCVKKSQPNTFVDYGKNPKPDKVKKLEGKLDTGSGGEDKKPKANGLKKADLKPGQAIKLQSMAVPVKPKENKPVQTMVERAASKMPKQAGFSLPGSHLFGGKSK